MRFLEEPSPDGEGKLSVTRLAFFLWAAGVLFVWIRLSLKHDHLAVLPDSVMYILGILMTGKVIQRNVEGNPPPSRTPPAAPLNPPPPPPT